MRDSDWEILNELHHNPNVSRAAVVLYMSQPSLTKRLQHMEAELGVRIAERTSHGLVFTKEGQYLCQRAADHLEFVDVTRRGLDEIKHSENSIISVGSSYTFNRYSLWDVLNGFSKQDESIRFDITNELSDRLFNMVLENKIDVAFVRGDYEGPVEKILIDKTQAFLVTAKPVELDELPHMQRVDYRTSPFTAGLVEKWWQDRFGTDMSQGMLQGYIDFTWSPIAHDDSLYTLCFLPDEFENSFDLNLMPLYMQDGTPLTRNSWCVYKDDKSMSEHLLKFVDYIKTQACKTV